MVKRPWTVKEEEYLLENKYLPMKTLVRQLGRTRDAIWQKMGSLRKQKIVNYSKRKPRKANEIFQWEKGNPETR